MTDDDTLVARHYETFSEERRLQTSRVRRLEFDTTLHVLNKHISPGARILELGAGHGAYSLHFAHRGHDVLATDLLAANVEAIRALAEKDGLGAIDVQQADSARLDAVADETFKAVLCLGPYYHLRTRDFRRRCLLECRRVVEDLGIVAVSYINRAFAIGYLLGTGKALTPDQYSSLMKPDDLRADYPDEFFNITHFSTQESAEGEVRSCGFEIVEHTGTDGVFGFSVMP
jgi:2-polyprenyl-3-methyl-5-hydroxy-6-metoxy-1,4-benzoquinol methylase